ncbi:hypothetical protein H4R18_005287 [Coemansia javaensis]|uniref:Peptidase S1 domain-containing protein n=1 Tax=Coemansia javaensis TaxID=2761396 RepID=A0A9W8LFL8_9FUNG|nr:hypothetical protein H4R18_005287 [Coemansia javaensis]
MRLWRAAGLWAALCAARGAGQPLSKRVTGGKEAADGQFPFAVYVKSPDSGLGTTPCAGAILHDEIIVTVAACVTPLNSTTTVSPGSIRVGYGKGSIGSQAELTPTDISIHSDYDPVSGVNNIALLKVNFTGKASSTTNRVPVYTGSISPNDALTVMGWGQATQFASGDAVSETLQYVDVKVGDDFTCKSVNPSLYAQPNGPAVCTRNALSGGDGPCAGDLGGPLVKNDNGVLKLVGLVASGYDAKASDGRITSCTSSNNIFYYTHINWFMSFLTQTGLSVDAFTGNAPIVGPPAAPSSKLSKGAIAGIAVAGAVALVLLCILGYLVYYRLKKRRDAQQEHRIYELGLQQLADELGGSYEPKMSSAMSAFGSSGVTPMEDNADLVSRASMVYRYIRGSTYSDVGDQPFSENIPGITEVGTELSMDSHRALRHADGAPKIMEYIRPERDGKITDYYWHLLAYALEDIDAAQEQAESQDLIEFL